MERRKILAIGALVAVAAVMVTARTSPAKAESTLVVYDDAFRNGFAHNPYNGRNNIANTTPVKVGARSISTTPLPWGGIFIDIPDGLALRNTTALRFWVNGGSAGLGPFMVTGVVNTNQFLRNARLPAVGAGQWQQVTIPFTKIVGDPVPFDRAKARSLWFTSANATSRPVIYLDQIELVQSAGTPPTTSPPTSGSTTTAPTTTTSTTPTSTTSGSTTSTSTAPTTTASTAPSTTSTVPGPPPPPPANCPANFVCDDFAWQGAHAASVNSGNGRTVWMNPDLWDAGHDNLYDTQDSYAHVDVHKAASASLSDGRVDNTDPTTGGAANTSGAAVMHVHETSVAAARLRTPIQVSAAIPGVVRFRASRFVTTGHWWEVALTPDIVGGEHTAVPGAQNLMAAPLRGFAPDHGGPGHAQPVDSVNFVTSGWPDDCSGGTYMAVRSSLGGVSTDSVNQVGSLSQLQKVLAADKDHLYAWQLRFWPDRVEVAVDLDENGSFETVQNFAAKIPWSTAYVHLLGVSYHAQAHPQGACNQGQDREFVWKQFQAGPVAAGATATFPKAVGTDNVPRRTGFMLTDFRDVQRFGVVNGLAQPNPAHYSNWGPVAFCSLECQLAGIYCPLKGASRSLTVDLPASALSGARSARLVYDRFREPQEGQARLTVNGQAIGVMPNASTVSSVEVNAWGRRSLEIPLSALRQGSNTVVVNVSGDVRVDRLELEINR